MSKNTVPCENLVKYKANDWVVVRYPLTDKDGYKNYIAKVISVDPLDVHEKFLIECLNPIPTKEHKGYIYSYFHVREEELFQECDILYKMNAPENWQRKLKFDKHCDAL